MTLAKIRRPSPLQQRILIVLAAMDLRRPGAVPTRDIERLLEQGGDVPVYGPNLRASCRRLEAVGWLRTLRAQNLQLAVELTEAGRNVAVPLMEAEQAAECERRRAAEVVILHGGCEPIVGKAESKTVILDGNEHIAWRADFVVRLDGRTCLQLWNSASIVTRLEGDPLQVAHWFGACYEAGLLVRTQVNESHTPEVGVSLPEPATPPSNLRQHLEKTDSEVKS